MYDFLLVLNSDFWNRIVVELRRRKKEEEEELRAVSIEPLSLRDMAKKTNAVEHLWTFR